MSDPSLLPTVVKKVLSLDTPVARRIFEVALLLGVIWFAAYIQEHTKSGSGAYVAAGVVEVFGVIVVMVMIMVLFVTILRTARSDLDKKE